MKKLLLLFIVILCFICLQPYSEAKETKENVQTNSTQMYDDTKIQEHISNVGYKLLNANQIDVRMIFVYKYNESKINLEPGLTKRQILMYDKTLQFAANDDEIAAYLAREIAKSAESYSGPFKGFVSSVQVNLSPKKYEIFFDKRAIDFMVKAGYNPLGLITFLNKSQPQKRFDKISRKNLTSKRLANVYEYIYTKYPYYLKYNEYIENEAYQHFLLSSIDNRKKLHEKIKSGSKKAIKYE